MSYTSVTHLIDAFGKRELEELTDRDRTGRVDQSVVDAVIAKINNFIDAHLNKHYSVPLSSVPDAIVDVATDLVREQLYTHNVPDVVKARADQARQFLRDVRDGKMSLPLDNVAPPSSLRMVVRAPKTSPSGY